jgi:hypothetical protein
VVSRGGVGAPKCADSRTWVVFMVDGALSLGGRLYGRRLCEPRFVLLGYASTSMYLYGKTQKQTTAAYTYHPAIQI